VFRCSEDLIRQPSFEKLTQESAAWCLITLTGWVGQQISRGMVWKPQARLLPSAQDQ